MSGPRYADTRLNTGRSEPLASQSRASRHPELAKRVKDLDCHFHRHLSAESRFFVARSRAARGFAGAPQNDAAKGGGA